MPEALNPQITDVLATNNAKTVGEKGSILSSLGLENAINTQNLANNNSVTAQKRLDGILEASMGQIIRVINESDLADQVSQRLTALASAQQGNKAAGTTPPVTVSGS